jgi:CotH kinase protein
VEKNDLQYHTMKYQYMRYLKPILLLMNLAQLPLLLSAQTSTKDLYDNTFVHPIEMRFTQSNWAERLDSMRLYGDAMLLATVKIDGVEYQNVGVNYRNTASQSVGSKRNAFKIKLNHIDKKQNHQGHTQLYLSNALRDPSMVREVLAAEILGKYMPAPRAAYANLSVNGANTGLFVQLESVNEAFLQTHFGDSDGAFFKSPQDIREDDPRISNGMNAGGCDVKFFGSLRYSENPNCYTPYFELLSKAGWDDLMDLTKVLNEKPSEIERMLNVDRILWLLAFNNVTVSLNSYSGSYSSNYYLYKDKTGRFSMLAGDMNFAFGSFKNMGQGKGDLDLQGLTELSTAMHTDNLAKPLVSKLLNIPIYKKMYYAHLKQILADCFENGWYERRAQTLQAMIQTYFTKDPNKTYTLSDFQRSLTTTVGERSKIPGIVELMSKRTKFLKTSPELNFISPAISDIRLTNREKYSYKRVDAFHIKAKVDKFPKIVRLYYRTHPSEPFKTVFMHDDGKSHDGEQGDKIFGAVIEPNGAFEEIEYYIVAENGMGISYEPTNYMFKTLKASLIELNK